MKNSCACYANRIEVGRYTDWITLATTVCEW